VLNLWVIESQTTRLLCERARQFVWIFRLTGRSLPDQARYLEAREKNTQSSAMLLKSSSMRLISMLERQSPRFCFAESQVCYGFPNRRLIRT